MCQISALGFLDSTVPKILKRRVEIWMNNEQKKFTTRGIATESEQLFGVVRRAALSHEEQYYGLAAPNIYHTTLTKELRVTAKQLVIRIHNIPTAFDIGRSRTVREIKPHFWQGPKPWRVPALFVDASYPQLAPPGT